MRLPTVPTSRLAEHFRSWLTILAIALCLAPGWALLVSAEPLRTITVSALQAVSILPTETLECTFSQSASSLADAQMLRVGVVAAGLPEVVRPHTCTGTTSPYACRFVTPPPATGWPVGVHAFRYRTGNVEADSTVSWGETVEHSFTVTPPKKGAPATPTNSILRKLMAALARVFSFSWIG